MSEKIRKTKAIHAYEILDLIASKTDPEEFNKALLEYGSKVPCNALLSLNFNHSIKMDLPEGMPPLDTKDMDAHTHPDFMGLLSSGIHRLRHCLVGSNLKKFKKEQMFYEVLINCPLKDAEILCSAKDHALEELYPSITAAKVAAILPAYVKSDEPKVA